MRRGMEKKPSPGLSKVKILKNRKKEGETIFGDYWGSGWREKADSQSLYSFFLLSREPKTCLQMSQVSL